MFVMHFSTPDGNELARAYLHEAKTMTKAALERTIRAVKLLHEARIEDWERLSEIEQKRILTMVICDGHEIILSDSSKENIYGIEYPDPEDEYYVDDSYKNSMILFTDQTDYTRIIIDDADKEVYISIEQDRGYGVECTVGFFACRITTKSAILNSGKSMVALSCETMGLYAASKKYSWLNSLFNEDYLTETQLNDILNLIDMNRDIRYLYDTADEEDLIEIIK